MILVENGVAAQVDEAVFFSFDNFSIPLRYGLQLGLVSGSKHMPILLKGKSGESDDQQVWYYGTVIRVDDQLRMWYMGRGIEDEKDARLSSQAGNAFVCRAHFMVSQDGFHWEKPKLGLVEYNGSSQNNRVDLKSPVVQVLVLYEPEDPDPERRFKMVFQGAGVRVAFSRDGLRWKEPPYNPVIKRLEPSGLVKFKGCYYLNGHSAGLGENKRTLNTHMSYDFEHWTEAFNTGFRRHNIPPRPEIHEIHKGEQVHMGASLWNRGNVFIGFYGMWHGDPGNDPRFTMMDLGLVVSNDAVHFQEPIPDFKIISAELERDGAYPALMQGNGFENIGDQTLVWYGAWGEMGWGEPTWGWGFGGKCGIRVASWPRDRFGYYQAVLRCRGSSKPHFISCPLKPDDAGYKVSINADGLSEHSYLKVEICDYKFRTLPDYSEDDCIPLTESGLRQQVIWLNRRTLDKTDQPIRIKVYFEGIRAEDSRVYAVYVSK